VLFQSRSFKKISKVAPKVKNVRNGPKKAKKPVVWLKYQKLSEIPLNTIKYLEVFQKYLEATKIVTEIF
jgi:hypothetical protein